MTNSPSASYAALPFTKDQFEQMKVMLNETIPMQEDNLRRAKASGLDVTDLMNTLAEQKSKLAAIITAWQDKYK
jgi:hypothetical protein